MIKKNRLKDGIKVVDDMFNDERREKIIKAMKDRAIELFICKIPI